MSDEYLTISEAAHVLRVKPKTLRNKIARGLFVEGVHFIRRRGLGLRFKRDGLARWLETADVEEVEVFALAQPGGRAVENNGR
jgi:excisionase family DNA binding protein